MSTWEAGKLDLTSRCAIGRFVLKLVISLLVANLMTGDRSYLEGVAVWLAFYGLFAMVGALLAREAIAARSFNSWDEAAWLMLAASIAQVAIQQGLGA